MSESATPRDADLRRQAEAVAREMAALSPDNLASLSPGERLETLLELRVHQVELEMQNEELRRAQAELDAARARYFDLYDLAPVGYCTVSEQGLILEANLTLAALLGVARGALVERPLRRFVLKQDEDIYYRHIRQLFETAAPQSYELRMVKTDGTQFWAHLDATAAQDEGGAPVCRVVLSDSPERERAEEALRYHHQMLEAILDNIPVMIAFLNGEGQHQFVNRCWQSALGWSLEEAQSKDVLAEMYPDPAYREYVRDYMKAAAGTWADFKTRIRDGRLLDTSWVNVPLSDGSNIGIGIEITARKQAEEEKAGLEAQLHQAQKMESVGRLAGGVAHDFNNMLGVILGHAEVALGRVGRDHPAHVHLVEIHKAAGRSANLTRQLLAFARKQTIAPKVLDLNETIEGILKMLRRLIGEDIQLAWQPEAGLWPVRVDPSQIDQILANLCVNARDAIADVGKLTIETANSDFDADYCAAHAGFGPGEYVRLAVSDDGCGMDEETLAHVFEPFFTTKTVGEGTGLGLAMVYGIVKQNDGFINVCSEPGHGTTFTIYLPRYVGKAEQARGEDAGEPLVRGQETILLVEDERAILEMTTEMLELHGYVVVAALTPGEAIRMAREHTGDIHLLMTDVVMPEMNGRDLAKNLLSIYPHIKRLFTSGYTADLIAHRGVLDDGVHFLQKPFSMKGLAAKVREALESE